MSWTPSKRQTTWIVAKEDGAWRVVTSRAGRHCRIHRLSTLRMDSLCNRNMHTHLVRDNLRQAPLPRTSRQKATVSRRAPASPAIGAFDPSTAAGTRHILGLPSDVGSCRHRDWTGPHLGLLRHSSCFCHLRQLCSWPSRHCRHPTHIITLSRCRLHGITFLWIERKSDSVQ